MKRIALYSTLLIGLLGGILLPSGALRAQCTITNLDPTYCSSDAPVALTGSPGGLTFYRAGVATPIASYDPSLVIGADTVVATSGVATNYTVSTAGTFTPITPPAGSTSIPLVDNSQTGPISIGFTFNFFGTDYTDVYIGSNAIIGFTSGVGTPLNQALPNAAAPNNIIALAWDEMTPAPGPIEYFVTGRSPFRKFVVNYNVYRDSNPLFAVRTQVQLHETTNIIEIHSTNINIPANFPTMGIEDATGTTGVPVPGRNDASFSVTNDYVAFIPDCVDIRYLTISEAPSAADAGPVEIEQCDNSTFVMSANTPVVGTGSWSVISGTATITNPTSPTTTITGIPAGTTATLRWTISNGGCTASTDDIDLINYELPSAADAGIDQENCNDGNFTMAAVDPAIGSGTWSVVSGTATVDTPGAFNTTVTGVPAGTSATLEWTVTNGTCAPNADQVVITNLAPPTTADAGPIEIEQCDNSTFVMSANTPVVGTGSWSVVSGTATITNPTSPTTTITGIPAGTTATLRWTISNGGCTASTDDIDLINYELPSAADAGIDQENCNDGNFTMAAVDPAIGSGTWSVVSGTATVDTPGAFNTTVTGVPAGTSATLEWTVTNGTCALNVDQVVITNLAPPTTADAGPIEIEQCDNSTFVMSANTPVVGTGSWSVVSGTATVTNPTSPTTTITGVPAGTTATLRWTISNGGCTVSTDDIDLINYESPSAADAGIDQENCNDGNFTMAAVDPAIGSGTWSVASGTATINTPGAFNTTVTGVPVGTSATLEWTVTNGTCAPNVDQVVITNLAPPTTADAGPIEIEQCDNSTFVMSANTPAVGTGSWSVVSGTATVTNPTSPTTTVTGVPAGTTATLRWTISNGGCTASTDDIDLINYESPSVADAGIDQENCNDGNFTMAAVDPAIGSGTWSVASGTATVNTPGAFNTTVTGVPAGTSATLEWTVTNGTCAPNVDQVIITNLAPPTTADAGPVEIEQCDNSTFVMSANTPVVGTGSWSVVSGTASITNPTSPTTTITGVPAGTTATLRWTISNGGCTPSTDDIDLINYESPSAADAGIDQENCNDGNFTMAAVDPAIGSGTWSVASGTATVNTPGAFNTTVTGVPVGTSATLEWTVTHGTCAPNVDQVVITNLAPPTIADAGPIEIEQCDNSTFVMSANTPVVGTGTWTVMAGTATITNPTSPTTTITGVPAGTTATLRWTISNGGCTASTDDIDLINYESPSAADAGIDQENCNDGNFTMAAVDPATGSGTWSVISGTATVNTPGAFNTTVTGVPVGTSATLEWTVTNGTCAPNVDQVVITNLAPPTIADAGPVEIEQCDNSTFVMSANTPVVGTGSWSVVSGTATITNPTSPTTTITGVPAGTTATLRWTISNGGCTASTDDIDLINYESPSAADAGIDQENCNDGNFTMAAVDPAIGSGTWSVISGTATVNTPGAFNTTVTGVPAGTSATLEWTVTNGTCAPNADQVIITNLAPPTTADAGPIEIEQCDNSTFVMSANTPVVGTGSWTVMAGTATITNPASPTTTITGVPAGTTATLRWTISNGGCTASTDDIDLINHESPSAADAGIDQENCNGGNFTMAAVDPAIGSGTWSVASGTATVNTPGAFNTTVTGVPVGTSATLEWTVTNGTCAPNVDQVVITNLAPPTIADAGPIEIEQCDNSTFVMSANTPAVGTGSWSVISGTATITNPTSPTTTITGVPAGTTATLRWTISNGGCSASTDDIDLINYESPSAADAGIDQENCNDGNFTMAAVDPAIGSGTWSVISGTATINTPGAFNTTVTGVPAGTSATLEWTVTNGTCAPNVDQVVITNLAPPTTADAGPIEIEQCDNSTFVMSANTPVVGTGSWSVVSGTATVTNPTSPTTTITGVPAGTTATLRWTISNGGCTVSTDDIDLVNHEPPSAAVAGPDQEQCNASTFTMAATDPLVGTGTWSVVSGTATITNPNAFNTTITGVAAGTSVTLEWRVENGTCADNVDQVIITNLALPTTADAGPDIEQCNNGTFFMSANTPIVGTGTWTVVSGTATITNPASPTTTITGVPAGTAATLRWTISNGVCAPSPDDIILTNHAAPSDAVAGPDQELCNTSTFTMAATAPLVGTGTWSVVSGTATVTSPNAFNTTITGVAPGTSVTLEWRVENGNCADNVDQVVITNLALPTTADAGATEIEQCNNSTFFMNANTPIVGTGSWTLVSGTAIITNPSSPTTTITGIAPGSSAILRWTISNGVCAPSSADIELINHAAPSDAVGGPDQELCNMSTFTMAATAPVIGTGTWSVVSGSATITSPNAFNTTITGVAAGTSVTLEWRIENGTCADNVDQVVITNLALPTAADAGPDIEQCNNGTFFMSANMPIVGTGAWTVVSGTATITNPASPTTTITGVPPGTTATLRWTISNGVCTSSAEDIDLINHAAPSAAVAGSDQENCNDGNFTMAATAPLVGTGTWSIVSGTATIDSPNAFNTDITGVPAGTSATLEWSVANGTCAPNVDQVVLTNSALPDVADAGPPTMEQCNNSTFFMSANIPSVGTGSWQLVSGTATIVNVNSPTTTVTNVAAGTSAILRWVITNGTCGSTTDDIELVNHELPTVASAGPDQEQCDNGDFTMAGNAPAVGSGTWVLISGTANIVTPTDRLTQVTGVPAGTTAILQWQITNGTCAPSVDAVTLTNYATPPVADAGPPEIGQCNNGTFAMNANSPGVGSGQWTLISGTATITNPTSPSTTITGVPAGTSATLRWTISNGVCGSTDDDIILRNYELATVSAAGPDQELCGTSTTLAANAPVIGTGNWTIVSGAGGILADPTDPLSSFDGVAPETYVLRWTITNGLCESTDEVTVRFKPVPDVFAEDKGICSGETTGIAITNPNGVAGTVFSWTVQSATNVTGAVNGSGNVINQALTVTDGVSDGTVVYRITPEAGGCSGTPLDITVTVSPKPVITTPPTSFIQSICSGETLNLLPASTVPTTTFNWTSSVVGTLTGVSASGTGAITDTPVNNTNVPAVIIYTVIPSNGVCEGTPVNYVITVNPIPDIIASDATICSGETTNVALSNPNAVAGTTFSWVVQSSSNVSGASLGSGNVIAQVLTSADGVNDGTVVYRVTPSANGCPGAFVDVTVTVKAMPVLTNTPSELSLQICSEEALTFTPVTTIPTATVNWTSTVTGPIDPSSVTASGSGDITDAPINTGNVSGTVIYHLIPELNGCAGPGADLVVVVRPRPSATASDATICSGDAAVINITSAPQNVPGTTFSWTVTPSANVNGAALGNGSIINQVLTTTDANVGTVVYTITPSANGCSGVPINVTVTVNPVATVSAGSDFQVCEPVTIPLSATLGGSATSATWTIVSGNGTLSSTTVTGTNATATYTVDPSDIGGTVTFMVTTDDPDAAGPCSIATDEVTVQVNPMALVVVPADYSVCEPTSINLSGMLAGSATAGAWSIVSGAGTLSVSSVTGTDVTATYIPDPSEIGGQVIFRLTSNDPDGAGPCVPAFDEVTVTINESAKVDAGVDIEVCEDQVVPLNASVFGSATSVTWSGGSGAAQFGDVNNAVTTYTLTPADILAGSITLVLTTNDPDGPGPCTSVSDQVVVVINPKPAVFLSGLAASYAENDPPVNMEGFPAGGAFTGPGVLAGTNVFDPGTANIGMNVIRYTYTDVNGCTNFAERTVVVNELTTTDFGVFNGSSYDFSPEPELCANIGRAYLRGVPDYTTGIPPTSFTSPDIPSRIGLDATGYYLDTDGLTSGQYYIQYTYTNSLGATSVLIKRVTVYAAPVAAIDADNACEEEAVQFTDLSTIPNNTLGGAITSWLWDFDDQDLQNSTQNPTYTYANPDVYDVRLTVTTDQGCFNTTVKQIVIGPPPVVDFTWSGICSSQGTQFTNLSTISGGFSTIESFQWDFGDGDQTLLDLAGNTIPAGTHGGRTGGTYRDPLHQFATFNEYNVRLTAVTDVGCVMDTVKRVYILDYPSATPTTGYFEDFEQGNGTWFKTSLVGTSWALGAPSGETINSAASGSQAWWTGLNPNADQDNSTYYNNEKSEVIGPCLDLTGLQRPMVSLNYWTDAQDGFDGAVLQYSINGGASWETIGDAGGAGLEWYNSVNVNGNPGGQDNFAWSASSGSWKNARYSLEVIPPAARSKVIFRIAFGANDDNLQGRVLNGFAFDDVYIGEKKRNVLVEHFTNQAGAEPATSNAEAYFNGLFEQVPFAQSDFFKLEYHISNPGVDSINQYNPAAPQARALFYGVSQPPATVMDGLLGDYFGTLFNGDPLAITATELDRRSLEDPLFMVTLDTVAATSDRVHGIVGVEYVDSLQTLDEGVLLQVALVDSVVDVSSARRFKYVVRKLLLGNGGHAVSEAWAPGVTYDHEFEEVIDVPVAANTRRYLVAFVQGRKSRKIHQSLIVPLNGKTGVRPVGLPDDPVLTEIRDILIYPNPASNVLYLNVPNRVTHDYTWNLVDQRGVTVLSGDVNRNFDLPQVLDIRDVANGIYFLQIRSGNRTLLYRKIAVMNRE